MTPSGNLAGNLNHQMRGVTGKQLLGGAEIGCSPQERADAAHEVGSAIAHQLNGPLTALRLYIGELQQNSQGYGGADGADVGMQQMVEGAFREVESVCAIMKLITERFEKPVRQEAALALGRDVINWWARRGEVNAGDTQQTISIHARLTPRERQVLEHVSKGCSNKQGAARMQIGPRTFEGHRFRIMRKLGAKNGADLVRIVLSGTLETS